MLYNFDINIPANTPQASPVRQELKLTHGIIHLVEVEFPPGCAGLAHCQILHWEHQAWPTNPDGNFAADSYTIRFDENYDLTQRPHNLEAQCWNDDDSYAHTITIRVGLIESAMYIMFLNVFKGLQKMLKLMRIT